MPTKADPLSLSTEPNRCSPSGNCSYCAAMGCAPLAGPIVHCGPAVGGGNGAGWSVRDVGSGLGRSGADHIGGPPEESTVDSRGLSAGLSPLRRASHSSSVSSRPPAAESSADHLLMASATSCETRSSLSSRPSVADTSEPCNGWG